MRALSTAGLIFVVAIVIGCAGSPESDDSDAAAPTNDQPTVTVAPAASVAADPDVARRDGCAPGDSFDVQKAKMLEILSAQFTGETQEGRPRLQFGPDSRNLRQGGIWMVLEFNGDEFKTVPLKKAALDRRMRDAYEALYTAGCEDLAQVDLASYQNALVKVSMMGETVPRPSIVYKTRLKRDVADTIDWTDKESLDFDEIWDTLLLNPRWRDELRELEAAE